MGVKLREKKLSNGQISFYLDIYHNKARWYEFLEIHINSKRPLEKDKEKRRLANEIRIKRENELIVQENGLIDKQKRTADFTKWLDVFFKTKTWNSAHNSTIKKIEKFTKNRPLSFSQVTPDWIKNFTKFLLSEVSNNSARTYLLLISTGLYEAERLNIITRNPFSSIERKDKLRLKDIFRTAWTIEELQQLAKTKSNFNPQIKQGYLFSCFTGLRWSDVNELRWSEIIVKQFKTGKKIVEQWFIYFEQQKTEGVEYLPLADQAVQILKQSKEQAKIEEESPFVFPLIKETDSINRGVQGWVNRSLKQWAKDAGLEKNIHFHTGRHTFATNVLESSESGDLYTVSRLLGHKNVLATQIYAKVRDKKKIEAVKALPTITIDLGPKEKVTALKKSA